MNDLFSLAGRVALITGGTRGIGRAISLRFAAAGATVIANYLRDQSAADELERQAKAATTCVTTCRADVTTDSGLRRLSDEVDANGGRLAAIVHCAATGVHRPLEQLTMRHFDWTYALNVRAFLDIVQRFAGRFAAEASILAVSSAGAMRAVPQYALTGSSKAALESLVRHLAVELAPRGIRVNALTPGTVQTDAWRVLPDADARLAAAIRRSPLGRLITPDEVAYAAHFLCSSAARGIVGQTLIVDGGLSVVE